MTVKGQLEDGAAQGLGYALWKELQSRGIFKSSAECVV